MPNITRRQFICGSLCLAGGLLLAGCRPISRIAGEFHPQFLRQIITKDPQHSRLIMWETEEPSENLFLEYRAGGGKDSQTLPAHDESFTADGETHHQYAVEIEGLKPGEDYEYRLLREKEVSPWYALQTAKEDGFTCLVFPDSQSSDYRDWQDLAQNAVKRCPEAEFFINLGDIVDCGDDNDQWRAWLSAVAGFREKIPFVPVMGNHETYSRQWQVKLPESYLNLFHVPDSGSESFSRYYYSFDWGPAHFTVLNTQWEETEDFKPGLKAEQLSWLRQDLAGSSAPWKIALLHKDVLQYRIKGRPERKEGISEVGESFMPLLEELNFDLVLTAHLHTYRNRGHIKDFRRNPAGPLYVLTGVAGNVRYPDLWLDHALDEVVAPQPETDNYLTLNVTPQTLTLTTYLPDGREIDRATLNKAVSSS